MGKKLTEQAHRVRSYSGTENMVDADLQIGESQVVYLDGQAGLAIVFGRSLFVSGFNVYRKIKKNETWEKVNPPLQFFTSYDAAKEFLIKKKSPTTVKRESEPDRGR